MGNAIACLHGASCRITCMLSCRFCPASRWRRFFIPGNPLPPAGATRFWERGENFGSGNITTHLVRDEKDLYRIVQYVAGNPAKAHLKDWQWVWCSAGFQPALGAGKDAGGYGQGSQQGCWCVTGKAAGKDAGGTGTFGPEDVFHYIYAVLHSPTYRSRYAEFLKIDFPRVPLTSDVKLFRSLCRLGAELVPPCICSNLRSSTSPLPGFQRAGRIRWKRVSQSISGRETWHRA